MGCKPLSNPQTGETVRPHGKFRLVATGNSAGGGDRSGLYPGVLRQNLALLDRFRLMEVGYPEPAEREAIHRIAQDVFGDDWL